MDDIAQIEKHLWQVADNLRANSNFSCNEYFLPVMGLIFLRHAYNRFFKARVEIEKTLPSRAGVKRALKKEDFSQRSAIFLPEIAQFPYLVALPNDGNLGEEIVKAMEAIENIYPTLSGALPKPEYTELGNDDLSNLLRTFNESTLEKADGDVFGRIYEYFLTQFADEQAHDGGEFFTPPSLVQTIVNVIEPDHGNIIDPACGSGGMFVQSAHFIEQMHANPNERVTFYGMEKNPTTIRLAKMNLAVHGLEGKIAQAISYYEDPHQFIGKADFVMANPPFNVDEIDAEKIKTDPRLTFGLPGVNGKGKVLNGNYVWMSYFHSYLSPKGRAGIVMSSQTSNAGRKEAKVRQAMIKTGDVDVMIAIRSNFFYTRSVPCELWFFDKNKPQAMRDKVLMIDARQIYNKVTPRIFDFTAEQKKNITAIVWLYRGEKKRFIALVAEHLNRAVATIAEIPLLNFNDSAKVVLEPIENKQTAKTLNTALTEIVKTVQNMVTVSQKITIASNLKTLTAAENTLVSITQHAQDASKKIDGFYKQVSAQNSNGNSRNANKRKAAKALDEAREQLKNTLHSFCALHGYAHWLLSRFPDAVLVDVPGLVKLVDHSELGANNWTLSPGRYVGVAPEIEDENFNFKEKMTVIHNELELLNSEAERLGNRITKNAKDLLV